jgi:membrane protease YdiL (CAAX protease family)
MSSARRHSENPFAGIQARYLVAWLVAASFATGWVLERLTLVLGADLDNANVRELLFHAVVYGPIGLWFVVQLGRHGIAFRRFFPTRPAMVMANYSWTLGIAMLALLLSAGSINLVAMLIPPYGDWLESMEPSGLAPSVFVLGVTLLLVAPFFKEAVFRGFLLHRWATKWGIRTSIIITSLLYGVLHLDIVGAVVFSMATAVLYLKTRSLWLPLIAHAVNNLLVLQLIAAAAAIPPEEAAASAGNDMLLAVGFTLMGGVPLAIYIWRNWPKRDEPLPYFDAPRGA